MEYQPDIYITDELKGCRYALGINGKNPIYVMGVNPSTATNLKPDRTISKVMKHARILGHDGFVMINLYPQRATCPDDLDLNINKVIEKKNQKIIDGLMAEQKNPHIIAAWGLPILKRSYLMEALRRIEYSIRHHSPRWFHLGSLTKYGHPRHPSRTPYSSQLADFDLTSYVERNCLKIQGPVIMK